MLEEDARRCFDVELRREAGDVVVRNCLDYFSLGGVVEGCNSLRVAL
jgi:hypothetical protein